MNFLTLEELKKQLIIDEDFHDDDNYLEMIGDTAEDFLQAHLCRDIYECVAENGGTLPNSLRHALRLLVDYFYSNQRGGNDESKDVPQAFYTLSKYYTKESIG